MEQVKIDSIFDKWAKLLVTIRREKNITQEELSYRSGVGQCHISYIETRKRNPTVGVMEALLNSIGHTICICEKEESDEKI